MVNRRPPPVREAAVNLNERRHLNGLDASGHRLHTFAQRVTQIIGIRVGWDRLIAIFRISSTALADMIQMSIRQENGRTRKANRL